MSAERYDLWTVDDFAPSTSGPRLRARNLTAHAARKRAERGAERYGWNGHAIRYLVVPAGAHPRDGTLQGNTS